MGWTTPITWTPGQVVGATDLNTHIRDNEGYLYNGRPMGSVARNAYYSTSSATFADIDATNVIITATLGGTRARTDFMINLGVSPSGGSAAVSVIMDSATYPVNHNATYGVLYGAAGQYGASMFNGFCTWTGITPGSHTFKLQWKIAVGTSLNNGAGTSGSSAPVQDISMLLTEY